MLQCFLCKQRIKFHFYLSKKLHDICMWNWVFRTRFPQVSHFFMIHFIHFCLLSKFHWEVFLYSPFTCNSVYFCNTWKQFTVKFSLFFTSTFILASLSFLVLYSFFYVTKPYVEVDIEFHLSDTESNLSVPYKLYRTHTHTHTQSQS